MRARGLERSPLWQISELARGRNDAIFLNIGEPDFRTPEHIIEAASKAMRDGFTHYSIDRGSLELRQAIVERIKEETGAGYQADSIIVTVGAAAANSAVLFALLDEGDEVLVPSPYYPNHLYQIRMAGGKPVEVHTNQDFQLEVDSLESKMSQKTKAMILLSPNNPTGAVYDRKRVEEIVKICVEKNIFIISDEVYYKFVYQGASHTSPLSVSGSENHVVLVNSFSKTYAMTGWRIGFVAAPLGLSQQILKCHYAMNLSVSSFVQKAALAALAGPQEPVREMVNEFGKRRLVSLNLLKSIQTFQSNLPQGAFYLFPSFQIAKMTSLKLAQKLASQKGVVVTPGSIYGRTGENHLRISYASSIDSITQGIDRIREFVNEVL